jgi:hypothetical protein
MATVRAMSNIFQELTPCSLVQSYRRMLVAGFIYFLTQDVAAVCSSELSTISYQTTRYHIPENIS